jgi:hypothetical protein
MTWDSSVGIVTSLRAVRARKHVLIPGWNSRCFSSPDSHVRWVPEPLFPAGSCWTVKRLLVASVVDRFPFISFSECNSDTISKLPISNEHYD